MLNSVLIIDDDLIDIEALTHILAPFYTIYIEKNGVSCINSVRKLKPDLILLDVIMPEISGFEVIEILKTDEDVKDIPVIFITAKASPHDEARGFLLGAVDYITKPFSPIVVKMRISHQMQIINQKQRLASLQNAEEWERNKKETAHIWDIKRLENESNN